jgi:hypothetical protein
MGAKKSRREPRALTPRSQGERGAAGWTRTPSSEAVTSVAILDLRVRENGLVFTEGLTRGRQDRLRPAERLFGASRRPARPAQRLLSDQVVAAGSSSVPSGS